MRLRLIPQTRQRRIVLLVLVGLLAVTFPLWRRPVTFAIDIAFPGPALSRAQDRTSDAAGYTKTDIPLPHAGRPETFSHQLDGVPQPAPVVAVRDLAALDGPTSLADPKGPGPVFVTTQDGRLHRVDLSSGESDVVLDLSGDVSGGSEQGLLGVVIDPGGDRLYLDYTNRRGDTEIRSWPFDGTDVSGGPDDGVLHLEIGQPYENHNGGNLVFGPDGALWIGVGDGGGFGNRQHTAQNDSYLLGKMLRVVPDPAGGVLALRSNGTADGRPEIWAKGLRNPWRYSFDRETSQLWIGDVGQNTIEEVSVVGPQMTGLNFGWSILEGNNSYHGKHRPGLVDPVITYDHDQGCAVAGGYVYRGATIKDLYGWYLFGDYCGGWVRAVRADTPEMKPIELLTGIGAVRSFGELEDGELVVLLDDAVAAIRPG